MSTALNVEREISRGGGGSYVPPIVYQLSYQRPFDS